MKSDEEFFHELIDNDPILDVYDKVEAKLSEGTNALIVAIALFVVMVIFASPFLIRYTYFGSLEDFTRLLAVLAIFEVWIGVAIGYFFGRKSS